MPIPLPDQIQEGFSRGTLDPNASKRITAALESGHLVKTPSGQLASPDQKPEPAGTNSTSPFSGIAQELASDPKKRDEFLAEAAKMGLEMGGSTIGAGVGGAAGGPPGAIAGAGLGSAGGNAILQLLQRTGAVPGEPPATVGEAAKDLGTAGAVGAAGEGAGQLIFKILAKGAKPFAKTVLPEAKEADEILKRQGGRLTPAQLTESRPLDLLENVAENSLFGGGPLRKLKLKNTKIFEGLIDDVIQKFSSRATKEQIGDVLQATITDSRDVFRGMAQKLYGKVDELAGGASVNIAPLKAQATEFLQEIGAGLPAGSARKILRSILDKGDDLTFRDAQILRSDLLSVTRQQNDLLGNRAQGLARRLAKTMDKNLADGISQTTSEEALTAFRNANDFWKQGKVKFNNSLIKSIVNGDPDVVLNRFVKPGKPTAVRLVREAIDNPARWKQVQGSFAEDIIQNATDIDGALKSPKIISQIEKFRNGGALGELFPGKNIKIVEDLEKFAKGLRIIEKGTPDKTGSIFIQLKQAGAAALAFNFALDATGATILLGPAALGKALTNPKIIKFLTDGIRVGKGVQAKTTFVTRLAALMTREGIEVQQSANPKDSPITPTSSTSPFSGIINSFLTKEAGTTPSEGLPEIEAQQ